MPKLIIRGEDDRNSPLSDTQRPAKLIRNVELKIYSGVSLGLTAVDKDRFNKDLLAFPHSLS